MDGDGTWLQLLLALLAGFAVAVVGTPADAPTGSVGGCSW